MCACRDRAKRVLESRLAAEQDRISDLEQSVVEAKQDATTSEQLLVEVSCHAALNC